MTTDALAAAERRAEQESAAHSQTLAERDHYHDVADDLALAIVQAIDEGRAWTLPVKMDKPVAHVGGGGK